MELTTALLLLEQREIMTDREIMQQALDALEYHTMQTRPISHTDKAIEALEAALAQPEQEELIQFKDGKWSYVRKPWQGLTDEEINDFDKKLRDNGDYCSLHFAWRISAKLKEKNT